MPPTSPKCLDQCKFRHLHPQVRMGTASDRHAGWLGQIYTLERYQGRIEQRTKVVGEQTLTEDVLPVNSIAGYVEHFLGRKLSKFLIWFRSMADLIETFPLPLFPAKKE